MATNLKLMQTLNARICHDLAGSIGTVDNCLGLLDTKNKVVGQKAKLLANEESSKLIKKIKIFRSIFGSFEGEKEMSAIYLTKTLKDYFQNTLTKYNIYFEKGIIYLDSQLAKASICLTLISSEYIINKGTINLNFSNDESGKLIKIATNCKDLKLKEDNLNVFNKTVREIPINISNCREHYVNNLCIKSGYNVSFNKKEGMIEYTLAKTI